MPGEIPNDILQRFIRTGDDSEIINYIAQRNYGDFIYQLEYDRQMLIQEQEQEKPGLIRRLLGR